MSVKEKEVIVLEDTDIIELFYNRSEQAIKELSEKYGETEKHICQKIEKYFNSVSNIAKEMMTLIGDWNDMEKMLRNFGDRSIREKLGKLIDSAESEDTKAYEQIKLLLNYI